MAITSTNVVTYESRPIDSGNTYAIFKVTTTTTVTTAPDTPAGTVVTESAVFQSVDYTAKLTELINNITILNNNTDRFASALETSDSSKLADNLQRIVALADGDGIKTTANWEWLGFVSMYQQYIENEGAIGLPALQAYKDKVNTLLKGS